MEAETGKNFPTTRRSLVAALADDSVAIRSHALEQVASAYWPAVYGYLRRRGQKRPDAEDLTQGFFAQILEKSALAEYDANQAKFRTWIRVLLDRFVATKWEANSRQKRGGDRKKLSLDFETAEAQLDLADDSPTAEELFDQEWIRSVFRTAVERLEHELVSSDRQLEFSLFERYDIDGPLDPEPVTYRSLSDEFNISESQVTNMLHRVRSRFRGLVESIILEITSSPEEARLELEELLGGNS